MENERWRVSWEGAWLVFKTKKRTRAAARVVIVSPSGVKSWHEQATGIFEEMFKEGLTVSLLMVVKLGPSWTCVTLSASQVIDFVAQEIVYVLGSVDALKQIRRVMTDFAKGETCYWAAGWETFRLRQSPTGACIVFEKARYLKSSELVWHTNVNWASTSRRKFVGQRDFARSWKAREAELRTDKWGQ